jgi:hypothetical protein
MLSKDKPSNLLRIFINYDRKKFYNIGPWSPSIYYLGQGGLTEGETGLYQLFFILKTLFTLFNKQCTLMRRSTVLSLPPQLVFPV